MEMNSEKAPDMLRKLIEYYNLSRCEGIPGDIPVVEVPIDKYDILALRMAIVALRIFFLIENSFKEDNDLMLDLDDWQEIKESITKAGDPDAH